MTEPHLFWTLFLAVLAAGILLVAFVWACLNISRREQAKEPFGIYLSTMLMVFAFLAAGLYSVL